MRRPLTEEDKTKIRDTIHSTTRRGALSMARDYEDFGIRPSEPFTEAAGQVVAENRLLRRIAAREGIDHAVQEHWLATAPPLPQEVLETYPHQRGDDPLQSTAQAQAEKTITRELTRANRDLAPVDGSGVGLLSQLEMQLDLVPSAEQSRFAGSNLAGPQEGPSSQLDQQMNQLGGPEQPQLTQDEHLRQRRQQQERELELELEQLLQQLERNYAQPELLQLHQLGQRDAALGEALANIPFPSQPQAPSLGPVWLGDDLDLDYSLRAGDSGYQSTNGDGNAGHQLAMLPEWGPPAAYNGEGSQQQSNASGGSGNAIASASASGSGTNGLVAASPEYVIQNGESSRDAYGVAEANLGLFNMTHSAPNLTALDDADFEMGGAALPLAGSASLLDLNGLSDGEIFDLQDTDHVSEMALDDYDDNDPLNQACRAMEDIMLSDNQQR